jgi:hypothetical protein
LGNVFLRHWQVDPEGTATPTAPLALHHEASAVCMQNPQDDGEPKPRPVNLVVKNGSKIFSIS